MLHVLNNPAQGAKIVHTAWGPFARVDVVETRYPDEKLVFTDGGAGSLMLRFQGDLEELAEYRRTVEFMPFGIGTGEDALIIGAGSGYDVLLALLGGAREVTAVEVNPAILAATRRFNDFNGGILDHPQIEWIQGEARTFVEWTDETYDLIYLNLVYTQAVEPANLALVENYIFTQEAFQAYINHLAPGGHLAIVSHNALEGSRAALTALSALAASGEIPLRNALDHISLWMIHQEDPTLRKSVLVVGRQSLREETISTLINLAERRSMTPLFVPKRFEFPFAPLRKGTSMLEFIEEDAPYDLSPTFDDRPYFFDLDPGLPPPVKQALWVSGGFSLAILVVSLGVVLLRSKRAELLEWGALILYTVLIGIGFMLVEIPLIHQFQLLLGFPVLSFSIVLGTLMLGAGLGSLVSQRWEDVNLLARVSVTAVGVGLGAVAYAFLLPDLLNMLLPASILWRITAACVITFVLGVFMGVPFPSLLRLTSRKRGRVGLLWAINGAFSVVGSTLAVVVSMSMGYQWAFVIGGGSYFLVAALSMYIQRLLY
jgi:predicted membrane-bound spermidine synthase